jgi:hypothetical protein
MKIFVAGKCRPENMFQLVDPTEFLEIEFEAEVIKALSCTLPDYLCGVFAGSFLLDGDRRVADLALIHKSFSHWFVVEVELASHSLRSHVLPQLRCFRFGEPEETCITSLCRAFSGIDRGQAQSLLRYVPRAVVVVTNSRNPDWDEALQALDIQQLTISVFKDYQGETAHEVEGSLHVLKESIGFANYSPTDNSLRLPKSCGLPIGRLQIEDPDGVISTWIVRESGNGIWITKERGVPMLPEVNYLQIIRTFDGRISLRLPLTS